jgi:succinate dehydrogenase / fumarate reductase membrane anchor subunit
VESHKRSAWGWFWQAVTGLALLLLLGLHMIAHHFVVEGGLRDFQQVVEYLSNPLIVVTELAFLVTVVVHAVLGVRAILFDLGLSARTERAITYAGVIVGVLTILYGVWLTYIIIRQGAALAVFAGR